MAVGATLAGGEFLCREFQVGFRGSDFHRWATPAIMTTTGILLSAWITGPWLKYTLSIGKIVNFLTLGLPLFPLIVLFFYGASMCLPGFMVGLFAGLFESNGAWLHLFYCYLVGSLSVGLVSTGFTSKEAAA